MIRTCETCKNQDNCLDRGKWEVIKNHIPCWIKKTTIQLIGSISGNPDAQKQFKKATEKLRKAGYRVINPFELCGSILETDAKSYWVACMDLCLRNLAWGEVDIAVVINDITGSAGAQIEMMFVKKLEITHCGTTRTFYISESSHRADLDLIHKTLWES